MSQCPPEKTCFNNLIKNEGFEIVCVPAGFYILDIMSSNNDSFTTKFIKQ